MTQRATSSLLTRQLREDPNNTNASNPEHISNSSREQVRELLEERIVKSGWLYKRTKTTKTWHRRWFVLRDYQFVYYKDEQEYKVEGIINTADIMTVAMVNDPKNHNRHFALFTPSNNVHLRADNVPDAQDWIDIIKQTSSDATESLLSSSYQRMSILESAMRKKEPTEERDHDEGIVFPSDFQPEHRIQSPGVGQGTSYFSGTDVTVSSYVSEEQNINEGDHENYGSEQIEQEEEEEKIIWKGYLLRLKNKMWKNQWVVLTNHRLIFSTNEATSSIKKIIELDKVIDVVEIDPLSKSSDSVCS